MVSILQNILQGTAVTAAGYHAKRPAVRRKRAKLAAQLEGSCTPCAGQAKIDARRKGLKQRFGALGAKPKKR